MTAKEIIEETVEYYSVENRAVVDGLCFYIDKAGCTCAVGRCLIDPQAAEIISNSKSLMDSYVYNIFKTEEELDAALKEKYRGHSMSFWSDLQNLHDSDSYWELDDNKLNEVGREEVKRLIEVYEETQ